MEILGVGPTELVFIFIIALIILGPKDMQKAGKTIGKWLRSVITSDAWAVFQKTSRELRTLPNRLMREANQEINEIGRELNKATNLNADWPNIQNTPGPTQPIISTPIPASPPETEIDPPTAESNPNESDQQKDA